MTKEQWLVYLWSIYPDGGFTIFWFVCLGIIGFLLFFTFLNFMDNGGYNMPKEDKEDYLWTQLGWWKIAIPCILLLFILISHLIPKREYFAYIIATPYVVESGKSIVETLSDPNSKLSKLNQIMDKVLNKVLDQLDDEKPNPTK